MFLTLVFKGDALLRFIFSPGLQVEDRVRWQDCYRLTFYSSGIVAVSRFVLDFITGVTNTGDLAIVLIGGAVYILILPLFPAGCAFMIRRLLAPVMDDYWGRVAITTLFFPILFWFRSTHPVRVMLRSVPAQPSI
jgi:hypothetical protein